MSVAGNGPAAAQEQDDVHSLLTTGFSLDVGILYPDRELNIRVDGESRSD